MASLSAGLKSGGKGLASTAPLGPYRATKLWNEVIQAFRTQMLVGRHRRYMKSYDDCFVASEAVSWLLNFLKSNNNFGPSVTRIQTVQLLNKFNKAGLFRDVRGSKGKIEFTDSNRLFRFTCESPVKNVKSSIRSSIRVPLSNRTDMMNSMKQDSDHVMGKPPIGKEKKLSVAGTPVTVCLGPVPSAPQKPQPSPKLDRPSPNPNEVTSLEVDRLWLSYTLERLREILQLDSLGDILEPGCVHVSYLIHNLSQINHDGLVTNIPNDEQLPPWVVSAMRCLAYWPTKVDKKLPDYPGFEKDVFKVVKEYFERMDEPLTTCDLYELFVGVMAHLENSNRPSVNDHNEVNNQAMDMSARNLTSYASVENLMANMTLNARLHADQDLRPQEIMIVHDVEKLNSDQQNRPSRSWGRSQSVSNLQRSRSSASILRKDLSTGANTVDIGPPGHNRGVENDQEEGSARKQYFVVNEKTGRAFSNTSSAEDMYTTVKGGKGYHGRSVCIDAASRASQRRRRAGSHNEVYRHRLSSVDGKARDRTSVYTATSQDDNFGYSAQVSAYPRQPEQRKSETSDKYSWMGSSVSITSSASSRPLDPPPYPSPPSYHSSCTQKISCEPGFTPGESGGYSMSTTASSYHTAHTSTTSLAELARPCSAHPLLQPDVDNNDMPGPHFMVRSKSRVSLQESYRRAVDTNGSTPGTPAGRSLYSSVRRDPARYNNMYQTMRSDLVQSPGIIAPTSRDRVLDALQLVCLFLPPAARRKLHFLLRLINRVSSNMELQLDPKLSNRDLMLNTFTRSILRSHTGVELDDMLTRRLVSFLVDHYQVLLQAPQRLKQQIEVKVDALKTARMVMAASARTSSSCSSYTSSYSTGRTRLGSTTTVHHLADHHLQNQTYCDQVSLDEYEEQRLSGSQRHLATLLEDIVRDRNMASKDKKKRLKQFQKSYPDIYTLQFPERVKVEAPSRKPKIRAPLLGKPLQRLMSMRV